MDARSSIDLLASAQQGGDDALEELLRRYLPRLRRWASGRLPSGLRTMLDTGDLVQDAVINALRNLNSIEIRDEGSLQSYLQRAVKNRIIDLYRRKGRRPARDTMPEEAAAHVTAPDEAAIRAEDLRRYRAALSRLREDDRKAVILWVERGLPHRDIAVELKKPSAAAARMTVNRALERLAREMRRGPSS